MRCQATDPSSHRGYVGGHRVLHDGRTISEGGTEGSIKRGQKTDSNNELKQSGCGRMKEGQHVILIKYAVCAIRRELLACNIYLFIYFIRPLSSISKLKQPVEHNCNIIIKINNLPRDRKTKSGETLFCCKSQ